MNIITEDIPQLVQTELFLYYLYEYLNKLEPIKGLPNYVTDIIEPYINTPKKRTEYNKHPKVREIKKDFRKFVSDWSNDLFSLPQIVSITVNPSPSFGLSTYLYIDFNTSYKGIEKFYIDNILLYNHVKFRFTDHINVSVGSKTDKRKIVEINNKKFDQCAKEMTKCIKDYINYLKTLEEKYIEKIKRQKRLEINNELDIQKEVIKLKIRETNLTEKLEQVSTNLYCTDYVGNVADLILNKPKAYRILYDSYFDIWCIVDANNWTHDKMAKEMFGSGYVEENSTNQAFTSFMYDAYKWLEKYLKGVQLSNREIYKSYGFKNLYLTGCMFIPYSDKYEQYEESSFYSNPIRLKTGILYAYDNYEFSNNGVLKDLYNALLQKDAILDSLENLWKDCVEKYRDDAIDYFYEEAEEVGYDISEIEDYLQFHLVDAYKM